MNTMTRLLITAAAVAALAACAKKETVQPVEPIAPAPIAPTQPVSDGRYTPEDLDRDPCLVRRVVYFDFDQADIKSEFAQILGCHAKYLRDRPSARITLEGHADERGSREYNLGLGERRGNAVNGALVANGGSASQLTVVSYGEERPTCNDTNESCWSQNRRVEIVYTAR
ncbi:MAG: peptidoglycan-associated lipoprotein Pal [Aquimonas sp.]|nr:peptidoglycan-associated lipoprotein Pal [Aquimonas sp.]